MAVTCCNGFEENNQCFNEAALRLFFKVTMEQQLVRLEEIAGEDLGGRGMRALIEFGELEKTCADLIAAQVIIFCVQFFIF